MKNAKVPDFPFSSTGQGGGGGDVKISPSTLRNLGPDCMIEAENLTKNYGPIRAVDRVSFLIPSGQVFGLLGPNGAGKTTTIKMLTTLSIPDAGRCSIDGFDVVGKPMAVKMRIGVVPQENNLDRDLTPLENLQIYARLHRVKNAGRAIESLLRQVDLWERKDSAVSHFSGGMQRRLLLARALLPKPLVLFLDEPSIGLDPQIRRQMWDMIRKHQDRGENDRPDHPLHRRGRGPVRPGRHSLPGES